MQSQSPQSMIRFGIEKSLKDLPALPSVVAKVLQEVESPTASAESIEKLVATDQAIASKVLRVVNSAYYGLSGQITSLSQAVLILGMQQVRNLVLSVAAISSVKPRTPRQYEVLEHFWLHAFSAAATTQILCQRKRIGPKDAELAFIGGLLHDIGRLFLFSNFTQTYDQILRFAAERELTLEEAEVKFLGMGHAEVGFEMASRWKLPQSLADLIGKHEGPFQADADPVLYCVHLADILNKKNYYLDDVAPKILAAPEAEAWLGFSEAEHAELEQELQARRESAAAMYGLMAA